MLRPRSQQQRVLPVSWPTWRQQVRTVHVPRHSPGTEPSGLQKDSGPCVRKVCADGKRQAAAWTQALGHECPRRTHMHPEPATESQAPALSPESGLLCRGADQWACGSPWDGASWRFPGGGTHHRSHPRELTGSEAVCLALPERGLWTPLPLGKDLASDALRRVCHDCPPRGRPLLIVRDPPVFLSRSSRLPPRRIRS